MDFFNLGKIENLMIPPPSDLIEKNLKLGKILILGPLPSKKM